MSHRKQTADTTIAEESASENAEQPQRTVWILDQYAVPTSLSGFTRQYEHAQLLSEHGWNARIVASPYNHKTHSMERPVSLRSRRLDTMEGGVPFAWVYTISYRSNNWRRYLNMLSFLVISIVGMWRQPKPDAILASSPHLFTGLAGWVLAKRFRVPFVFEIRDLWPESLVQLGLTNPVVVRPLELLEKFLYRQADAIVCLTAGIRRGVLARKIAASKLILVPNGVDFKSVQMNPDRDSTRESLGWKGKFVAGWVGAHGVANQLQTIVMAAEILHRSGNTSVHFVFIGDGPDKPALRKMASSLSNVEFMDPVPKSEVFDYLSVMDAGLIVHTDTPAVHGARPNKLFDYMAVGLPVISNLQGETQELIDQAGCGITVAPTDPESLAKAVCKMGTDPSRARQIGARGIPFLINTHDRNRLVVRLADTLQQLSTRKSASVGEY